MMQPQQYTAFDRALIVFVVMSATLMQVIDTTIVNVALPRMQGALNASPDEITWTLTSYMVSSAIFMPLTGYFTDRLGRRNYLLLCISGFTLISALCGASTSLSEIVFFRLLQGAFGAGLVPLSQAVMTDIFPPKERGKAMALWGIGVMVGPALGPTLGGYLTEVLSWRWTFYVNVPFGLLTLLLVRYVPDTPIKIRSMDWIGLLLISFSIGGLQYVLDRGNQLDWFGSLQITLITVLTFTSFVGFIIYSFYHGDNSVFDMAIFKDRNFTIACLLLAIFGLGLYGTMVIQPLMMESLLNYPVMTAGFMLAPRGLAAMVSMMLVGQLINRIDTRFIIGMGVLITAAGMGIGRSYSLNISPGWIGWPMVLQGFGLGMIFVPLSTTAYATLAPELRAEAAGLYSLLRTIGGSIGISIAITLFTRRAQYFWNQLGGALTPYNPAVYHYLKPLHLKPSDPLGNSVLQQVLHQHASMLAMVNAFDFITWSFLLMIPVLFLLQK